MRPIDRREGRKACRGFLCIFLLILILISEFATIESSQAQSAGTVRGRLLWQRDSQVHPAGYLAVKLLTLDRARSFSSYTDFDGFYYFYNIQADDYLLEIWYRGMNERPLTYRIRVLAQPLTDVKPILLR